MSNKPEPKLEDRLRGAIRLKQYSPRTEETYIQWYRRFVLYQAQASGRMRHPALLFSIGEIGAICGPLTPSASR